MVRFCCNTLAVAVVLTLLSACSASPQFANPPPLAATQIPVRDLAGTWRADGKDNGERARVVALDDARLRIEVHAAPGKETPLPPIDAQITRFAGADWAMVDRRLLVEFGKTPTVRDRAFPYVLVRYSLDVKGRLCGQALGAPVFADAVRAGTLAGRIDGAPPREDVSILSDAAAWMDVLATPSAPARLLNAQTGCFVRVWD